MRQTARVRVGLDHCWIRGWTGWHRFITLAMLALAVLTILAVTRSSLTLPRRSSR